MRPATRTFCAALAAVALGGTPAFATTYTVDSLQDLPTVTPGLCTATNGACTLRAAVQAANAHPGADVIVLPAGLFLLSRLGPAEDLGDTGDLDVSESLEIDGAGVDATIVDGLGADRVLQSSAATLTLRDFTVRRGLAGGSSGAGLLQSTAGNVTLERMRFASNVSDAGGGVSVPNGALTIADSAFDADLALAGDGGALNVRGTGNLSISNTTFTSNAVLAAADGGALFSTTAGTVTIAGCTFSSNTAEDGGATSVQGSSAFSLSSSTFEDNRATATAGGFLYSGPGAATITGVTSFRNSAGALGGGYASSVGPVEVSASEFSDNVTSGGDGAGLYVGGSVVTVTGTVLRRNIGGGGVGGGLQASVGATLTLIDVEATDNSGASGAGFYLSGGIGSTLTLTRVRALRNNSGVSSGGGGIFVTGNTVVLADSTIDGNAAFGVGGGLYASTPLLTITNSTISNNRAIGGASGSGGGLFYSAGPGSTISNVTFSGNVAEGMGGGADGGGSLAFRNATFADNTAAMGSAIFNLVGTLTLASSIVSGSAASHCAGAAITSGDFNIDSDGTCGLTGANDRNNVDPQLGPLADNGGPTLTHLPAASSPAIDGGEPTGCPGTDQRGQARPIDGNGDGSAVCDVGAVEFLDLCPSDPAKTLPGICGCGVPDADAALPNGVADCLINGELKARIARAIAIVTALTGDPSEAALETELNDIAGGLGAYVQQFKSQLVLADPKAKLDKLAKTTRKTAKKVTKAKAGKKLVKARRRALGALGAFDRVFAP